MESRVDDVHVITSELVALVAVSCTLFLFLHTRELSTKLRQMQRLNDDVTAFNHLTDNKSTPHSHFDNLGWKNRKSNYMNKYSQIDRDDRFVLPMLNFDRVYNRISSEKMVPKGTMWYTIK
ncbi:Heparan sulfate 2-o-sulfotransferase pipe [Operophtera brumata]|uniref:Heparan sulfate 2-o-sulfotransferase pipe n=1 Tax=Operophtera brumata TaxID=104452 RepID=A0A0L7LS15_OPEBR|nr:Heparan sulfate 2-o-sulfotransferase pipe [Operophtera brumata]